MIKQVSDLTTCQLIKGAMRCARQEPDDALFLLEEAAYRRPDDPKPLRLQAQLLYSRHELRRTELVLRMLLARVPDDRESAVLLVKVLRRQGRSAEASHWYARIVNPPV